MDQELKPKKTGGNRNRVAGHAWERSLCDIFREAGFEHVVSCRSESRNRDAEGVDLINKNERVNGRLPYNVQAKNSNVRIPYNKLLSIMPKVPGTMNVVMHKMTKRSTSKKSTGKLLIPEGYYALCEMSDFMAMVARLKQLEAKCGSL